MPDIVFFQRPYPSANSILLTGPRPVLVDSGFGADSDALLNWLSDQGVSPEKLSLVINTHHHADHVGGNHRLQSDYGIPIAAHHAEAKMVNWRDPDACAARWLDQVVEPYTVDRPLHDGDVIGTGGSTDWLVIEAPGHTKGHIALHAPDHGVLLLGDAVHAGDVGWLNPYHDGADVLERSLATLARLGALAAGIGYSGHGPAVTDVAGACAAGAARLRRWQDAPEAAAWHACKRIFAHALIVADGLDAGAIATRVPALPWVADFATRSFAMTPAAFVPMLVAEMLRAGAARWQEGRLRATAASRPPRPDWQTAPGAPALWPRKVP